MTWVLDALRWVGRHIVAAGFVVLTLALTVVSWLLWTARRRETAAKVAIAAAAAAQRVRVLHDQAQSAGLDRDLGALAQRDKTLTDKLHDLDARKPKPPVLKDASEIADELRRRGF